MYVRAAAVAASVEPPAVTTAGRLARASTFAGSSVALAVAAHAAAGGHRPSATLLAGAFGLLTRIAYGLAGRERRFVALLAGVGLAQLALHITFAVTAHGPGMAGAVLTDGTTMTVAHVSAAALVAAVLGQAERGLWNAACLRLAVARCRVRARSAIVLLRNARRFAATLLGPPLGTAPGAEPLTRRSGSCRSAVFMRPAYVTGRLFARTDGRRGPPLGLKTPEDA
ncbi:MULTISPECIES: hypothetical protein [unclassified Frankia]|uniref:hypothetical protein n=1 Tax=unclassified Frankia TaxID=2632575 RepID=UPI001EF6E337|nr:MULTISPECIES: hypothetical protein [unclassified Frankia]